MMLLETLVSTGVDEGVFELTMQTLATLTESIQGPCPGNQKYVISQNAGGVVTALFTDIEKYLSPDNAWAICKASMSLLLSLLEGHTNFQMISMLMQSISVSVLIAKMDATYEQWAAEKRGDFRRHRSMLDQLVKRELNCTEFSNCERNAVQGYRRKCDCNT